MGVGPEVFVPLCFEKSSLAVIAVLGVIKAGGAYVFLDHGFPTTRLQGIYKDLNATLVITSSLRKHVGSQLSDRVVCLEHEGITESKSLDSSS
jgi:non-ribosomal peptide synthetase component F